MKASSEMIPPFPSNKTVAAKENNSHLSSADNSGRLPVLLHPGHHHPSLQLPSSRHCCHPATNLVFAHFRQHWQHCCCCPLSLSLVCATMSIDHHHQYDFSPRCCLGFAEETAESTTSQQRYLGQPPFSSTLPFLWCPSQSLFHLTAVLILKADQHYRTLWQLCGCS